MADSIKQQITDLRLLKKGTKTKWFFFSRLTRQNTIVYGYRTDFEDGLLVGWRELD
tara:strand:+ start:555 stop:722 length:168 start_codon:yes stop_codon:yes gene_type:complete